MQEEPKKLSWSAETGTSFNGDPISVIFEESFDPKNVVVFAIAAMDEEDQPKYLLSPRLGLDAEHLEGLLSYLTEIRDNRHASPVDAALNILKGINS